MKKFLLILALLAIPATASAQCNGVFPANTICGTVTGGVPKALSTSVITGVPGGSSGQVQFNNAGSFGGITAANNALFFTNGSGVAAWGTAIPNGITATTQTVGDSTTKVATDAFVTGSLPVTVPYIDLRNISASACTGSDDTATIQSAVAVASALFGGNINIFTTACLISSPGIDLTNKGNITFHGQGNGRNLNAAVTAFKYTSATGSLAKLDGAIGVTFENISLQATNASYNGDLFDLRQVSGSLNTFQITFRDCSIVATNGAAPASLIRTNLTLSTRIERCYLSGGVQTIKGGVSTNGISITDSFFDTNASTTSHIGTCGQGWKIDTVSFEPTHGIVTNNIIANCETDGLDLVNILTADGGSGTPVNLVGAVVKGFSTHGGIIQGGDFAINAGSAVGVDIAGTVALSNNSCNIIVSSATHVHVTGYSNVGIAICSMPTGPYIIDTFDGTSILDTNLLRFKKQTFASLPGCAAGNEGTVASITDSSTATWGAAITGGSTNHVMGYCDGTNWTVMGK